jgi:hypothetical protein
MLFDDIPGMVTKDPSKAPPSEYRREEEIGLHAPRTRALGGERLRKCAVKLGVVAMTTPILVMPWFFDVAVTGWSTPRDAVVTSGTRTAVPAGQRDGQREVHVDDPWDAFDIDPVAAALRFAPHGADVVLVEDEDGLTWIGPNRRVHALLGEETERCWWTWEVVDGHLVGGDARPLGAAEVPKVLQEIRRLQPDREKSLRLLVG